MPKGAIGWALNEEPIVTVKAPGVVDVTTWRQKNSMTVHLVNLTNAMMMKGPFKELIPVEAGVSIKIPQNTKVTGVRLFMAEQNPKFEVSKGMVTLTVPKIMNHGIIELDLK